MKKASAKKYSVSTLDFITAMMRMNNDCNYDNPTLGRKIAESLNWFSEHNDVLEKYFERQMNLKKNME
jgi:hypothetical protein